MPETNVLTTQHILEYPYHRSTGPTVGRFLTGLRDGVLVGSKGPDGRVHVPPCEFDPKTAEPHTEMVEVGPGGVVATWTWMADPLPNQPFEKPFAYALVVLDGADTGFLHAVEVEGPDEMSTGMRVTAKWRDERVGHINDLIGFVPEVTK